MVWGPSTHLADSAESISKALLVLGVSADAGITQGGTGLCLYARPTNLAQASDYSADGVSNAA